VDVLPKMPLTVGPIQFSYGTIFMSLFVTGLAAFLCWLGTRRLKEIPGRWQAALELFAEAFDGLVKQSLGEKRGRTYLPLIGTLFIFVWFSNLIGLIPIPSLESLGIPVPAFEEPTGNLQVPIALGLLVMVLVHVSEISIKGLWAYIKGYFEPICILFPLNLVGKVSEIISISFRLFGNIFGGKIIIIVVSSLLYFCLLPIGLSLFFGIFVGSVQAFVFTMLALTYTSIGITED